MLGHNNYCNCSKCCEEHKLRIKFNQIFTDAIYKPNHIYPIRPRRPYRKAVVIPDFTYQPKPYACVRDGVLIPFEAQHPLIMR